MTATLADQIRAAVRQARIDAGMTAKELAACVGADINTIYAIEQGLRKPSVEFLDRLCTALRLTVHIGPAGGEGR